MKSFDLFFGMSLAKLLLKRIDNLRKALQSCKMSAAKENRRHDPAYNTCDENFLLFWEKSLR